MHLTTPRGYGFFECASAMQKAIRRNETKVAGYFAIELFNKYPEYVWKRLLVISAEDCAGIITLEIQALYEGYRKSNGPKQKKLKGRVFVAKAVIILSEALKNR